MGTGQYLPDILPGTPNFQYVAGSTTGTVNVPGYIDAIHLDATTAATLTLNGGDTIALPAGKHLNLNLQQRMQGLALTVTSGTVTYVITYLVPQ